MGAATFGLGEASELETALLGLLGILFQATIVLRALLVLCWLLFRGVFYLCEQTVYGLDWLRRCGWRGSTEPSRRWHTAASRRLFGS